MFSRKDTKTGWERVQHEIETDFVQVAKESLGQNLYAILLYGSAARGMYQEGVSDINLLILYHQVTPVQLSQFGKKAGPLIRRHRITPLLMSREEFLRSSDVFPLEYIDIRNAHRVLFGPDDTASLELSLKNLRHQAEERLRGSLNQLRQLLVAAGGNSRLLSSYLRSWSGISSALSRALLLLQGKEPNIPSHDLLAQAVEKEYELPPGVFNAFQRFRGGEKQDPIELAGKLMLSFQLLSQAVDRLPEEPLKGEV